jgi:hypothetical protein
LHDCQCCDDGTQHAATDCPKWSTAAAKAQNARRLHKALVVIRNTVPDAEGSATRGWFQSTNPARSGDKRDISWMVKGFDDFYHEDYRSAEGQIEIIERALANHGDTLRVEAASPTNRWLRNVATYLLAVADGAVDELHVKNTRPNNPLDIAEALERGPETYGHVEPGQPLVAAASEAVVADDDDHTVKKNHRMASLYRMFLAS